MKLNDARYYEQLREVFAQSDGGGYAQPLRGCAYPLLGAVIFSVLFRRMNLIWSLFLFKHTSMYVQ
jgi:hypothetical protein